MGPPSSARPESETLVEFYVHLVLQVKSWKKGGGAPRADCGHLVLGKGRLPWFRGLRTPSREWKELNFALREK